MSHSSIDEMIADKTFCPAPWTTIEIGEQGQVRPCCVYYGSFGNLTRDSLQSVLEHPKSKDLKNQISNGKLPGECWHCAKGESMGITSRRIEYIRLLKRYGYDFSYNENYFSLVLRFSNVCNLACRHCRSSNSSKWSKWEKVLNSKGFERKVFSPYSMPDERLDELSERLFRTPGEKNIVVKGGEPTVDPKFFRFIRKLNESKAAQNIDLHFFTNGSEISEELLQELAGFKKVLVMISIEASGRLYQYIRNDRMRLEKEILANALRYKNNQNTRVVWRFTLSVYSLWQIDELFQFACVDSPIDTVQAHLPPKEALGHVMQQRVESPKHLTPAILNESERMDLKQRWSKMDLPDVVQEFIHRYLDLHRFDATARNDFVRFTSIMDNEDRNFLSDAEPNFLSILENN